MKKKRNKLFEEAMDQFNRLAQLSLEALKPYELHSRSNCSTVCDDCRLGYYYKEIADMVTFIPGPRRNKRKIAVPKTPFTDKDLKWVREALERDWQGLMARLGAAEKFILNPNERREFWSEEKWEDYNNWRKTYETITEEKLK